MIINDDIAENILFDWRKKDITREEKSIFVNSYIKEKGLSLRELARRTGISHSTLQDWSSMRQVKKYYENKDKEKFYSSNIFSLADRLTYLISKTNDFDEKTKLKLEKLKKELEYKFGVKNE